MVRAIYSSATAAVRVPKADGTNLVSDAFPVDRGVVQGDIVSPFCFIIALQHIRQLHDIRSTAKFGDVKIECLEYADDAALIDMLASDSSKRITALANGAKLSADMEVSVPKTEVMHVKRQPEVTAATHEDVEAGKKDGSLSHECICGARPYSLVSVSCTVAAQVSLYKRDLSLLCLMPSQSVGVAKAY